MNTIESSDLTARACDEIALLRKALEGIYNISEHANTALIWIQMEDINWNISNKIYGKNNHPSVTCKTILNNKCIMYISSGKAMPRVHLEVCYTAVSITF